MHLGEFSGFQIAAKCSIVLNLQSANNICDQFVVPEGMYPMEKLLDASAVSDYLNISKRKFEQLLAQGEGPRHFLIGRQRRWRHDEINEWIDQRIKGVMPSRQKPMREDK